MLFSFTHLFLPPDVIRTPRKPTITWQKSVVGPASFRVFAREKYCAEKRKLYLIGVTDAADSHSAIEHRDNRPIGDMYITIAVTKDDKHENTTGYYIYQ